jgi:thiamine biosynthesis lipoprotein
MACVYAIDAYGPDAAKLPRIVEDAFDEVDRIDRLMSHYKADSPLSRVNREAAQHPVAVEPELFDFIADAMRYNRESGGAFDITVGPRRASAIRRRARRGQAPRRRRARGVESR